VASEDLLAGQSWECRATVPGSATEPGQVRSLDPTGWLPATVPGTAAGATRSAGGDPDCVDYDAVDWWFRCEFAASPEFGPHTLQLEGLATLADVWVNDRHVLHAENMFRAYEVDAGILGERNEIWIRFASMNEALAHKRPRPRWKSYLVSHQNLRFVRTSLLGRLPGWAETPAPVGPYKPVRLVASDRLRLRSKHLVATCAGAGGRLGVDVALSGAEASEEVWVVVADERVRAKTRIVDGELAANAEIDLPVVKRWWPHTHGPQPLYDVDIEVAGSRLRAGRVGFRTVEIDRTDGDFRVIVNGEPVFVRGAVWMPVDPVGLAVDAADDRRMVELARSANLNMIRPPGTGVYMGEAFWDACDELGIMVWFECMLAFCDTPEDSAFLAELEAELTQQLDIVSARPAVALVCGSQEVEEQATMAGPEREKWEYPVLEDTIPKLVAELLPGVAYIPSNPTGGSVPFQMDSGVSQYFGVGGYLRPVEDSRRSRVKFAAECLAFATPPERRTIDEECGGSFRAGHDPGWKRAVHHDAGRSWDLEDMQGFYVKKLFGLDPFELRYSDADRALDVSRAAVSTLYEAVLGEWRRPGSPCGGALVLALRDLRPGPGWGVIDSFARPKAPWYALKRVMSPVGLVLTDEGLNGLHAHVLNDTSNGIDGTLRVDLYVRGELLVERAEVSLSVPARGGELVEVAGLFNSFRDLTNSFGFGPPSHDVVGVSLLDPAGSELATVCHVPGGGLRPVEPELGLGARVSVLDGSWALEVSTRRFAQWVVVECAGFRPGDSWFHLAPGASKVITLEPEHDAAGVPAGEIRALNSQQSLRFSGS
jgi:beta-mannosidase